MSLNIESFAPKPMKFIIDNNIYHWICPKDLPSYRAKRRYFAIWRCCIGEEAHTFKTVNSFQKSLSKQSKFTKRLDFYPYPRKHEEVLVDMSEGLKKFSALKSLRLKLVSAYGVTNIGMVHLNKSLKRCAKLRSLDLMIPPNYFFDDKSLEILTKSFKMHVSLIHLSLHFDHYQNFTDVGIKDLCKGLRNLILLQSLNLCCPGCLLLTDDTLLSLSNAMTKLQNLKEIRLDFQNCCRISFEGIGYVFSDSLFQKIRTIFFGNFSGYNFIRVFKSPFFTKAVISVKSGKDRAINLRDFLMKLPALQNLTFQFSNENRMSRSEYEYLSQALKAIPSLSSLIFQFWHWGDVTDEELESLSQFFKSLGDLKHIYQEISGAFQITENGLRNFSKGLEGLSCLEDLDLQFYNSKLITDKGLKILSQSLKNMVSLKKLKLCFSSHHNITDSGIKTIVKSLKNLVVLQEVSLEFSPIRKKTTYSGQLKITKILKKHVSLKKAVAYLGLRNETIDVEKERISREERRKQENWLRKGVRSCFSRMKINMD